MERRQFELDADPELHQIFQESFDEWVLRKNKEVDQESASLWASRLMVGTTLNEMLYLSSHKDKVTRDALAERLADREATILRGEFTTEDYENIWGGLHGSN